MLNGLQSYWGNAASARDRQNSVEKVAAYADSYPPRKPVSFYVDYYDAALDRARAVKAIREPAVGVSPSLHDAGEV